MLKGIVVNISWWFAAAYQKRHKPIVIGVVGSVGKTGTKRAIAQTLSAGKRVAWQDGNYNDIVTVPLIYFGLSEPSLFNPIAWILAYLKMGTSLYTGSPAEVVVLELGTDEPGQIPVFKNRLKLDYAVVTAVSYEHMQNFSDLMAVASEELSVVEYSENTYLSKQIKDDGLANNLENLKVYGNESGALLSFKNTGQTLEIRSSSKTYKVNTRLVGNHQYNALVIAAELAERVGLNEAQIIEGLESVTPMAGRMQLLDGKDDSTIIDDTYNSSPEAVKAALDYLYNIDAKKKIAVLGNMNEMGEISEKLHREIGKYCDKSKLDMLITIGPDANKYLAESAKEAGCSVKVMQSPVEIGRYLAEMDLTDTSLLLKGSQNKVFLEEAIKPILKNEANKTKLVRQSKYWLAQKAKQFKGIQ